MHKLSGKIRKCPICLLDFYRPLSKLNEIRCSRECANKYISSIYKGNKKRLDQLASVRGGMKGKKHTKIVREKISNSSKAFWQNPEYRKKHSEAMRKVIRRGEKSNLWKGGIATVQNMLRHTIDYKLWRMSVFERDKFTCVWCGQVGGKLQADHIKEFAKYPELRFIVSNGRTLCQPCHCKRHKRFIPNN